MFLVMFILPQILYVGDKIVEKTRFNIKVPEVSHSASGTVYVNGRVRGGCPVWWTPTSKA